jgi:hypothetical protein
MGLRSLAQLQLVKQPAIVWISTMSREAKLPFRMLDGFGWAQDGTHQQMIQFKRTRAITPSGNCEANAPPTPMNFKWIVQMWAFGRRQSNESLRDRHPYIQVKL